MNENLEKLIKLRNINIEEIGLDVNKEEFTIEEIYNLIIKLEMPGKNFFSYLFKKDFYYTSKSFKQGIIDGEINKVVNTILGGFVLNVNDKLYFVNTTYRVSDKQKLDDEIVKVLFELLLMNGKWEIVRKLSSKTIFYKFNNIFDERFPKGVLEKYLFGDYDFNDLQCIAIDYFFEDVYNQLEDKSKEYIKSQLMENYRVLFSAYLRGKAEGSNFEIGNNYFAYFYHDKYYMYFIDKIYLNFTDKEQVEVRNIIEVLK